MKISALLIGSLIAVICQLSATADEKKPNSDAKKTDDYIIQGLQGLSPILKGDFKADKYGFDQYSAAYKNYLEMKAKESDEIEKCRNENPKRRSQACITMGEKFIKDLEDGIKADVARRKSFADDCKKLGGTPHIGFDFFSCESPSKAATTDRKITKPIERTVLQSDEAKSGTGSTSGSASPPNKQ